MKCEKYKEIGGLFPTLFDFADIWRVNRGRCNGNFNIFFFWLYPIVGILLVPFTILCFFEALCTKTDNK